MRSQLRLRAAKGYDSNGRTAYALGHPSRVSRANQWARATQTGRSPAAPNPALTFTASAAAAAASNMTAVLTFGGAVGVTGNMARVNWGDGTIEWFTIGQGPISHLFATIGAKTITVTIGGANQTPAFTASA